MQIEYEKHLFQTVSTAMRLVATFQNINCTKDSLTVLTEIFQDDVRLFRQGASAEAYLKLLVTDTSIFGEKKAKAKIICFNYNI